ncbi:hypothetical protein KOAAANKH_02212 [Brevundimonas sp. NIBR10]|uniref:DUF433 domain-containing protein n=1 Tax=Brevundimonas sp. NIBR10 TaxID=3015997 RepID=UPI0022F1AF43|nr:DUF433 domain-containing protein [Brevundimonas sp. NIBR10]WGM47337.1 hypothetical protein KOAAANKH_02212 [Brevundimonas sp. NIBR10]
MSSTRLYTVSEAAAVSGLPLKAVNNSIDKGLVEIAPSPKTGRSKPRVLTGADLVSLRLEHGLAGKLPIERRLDLFRRMAARPKARHLSAGEFLMVDVAAARRDVTARIRTLGEAEAAIVADKTIMGGEPVFKGTRIPVYAIAAMLEAGASEIELLDGYPKLDSRLLRLARIWVAAHPRRGRPKRLEASGLTPTSVRHVVRKSVTASTHGSRADASPGR